MGRPLRARKGPTLLVAAAVLCLAAPTADATTLRCKGKLIRVGDPDSKVRQHCGAPSAVDRVSRFFHDGGTLGERCFFGSVSIEHWQYERGRGIPATVTVVGGKVERITLRTGGYTPGWRSPCR